MRPDGNLVDYSRHGGEHALGVRGTGGHFGAYARLQFDGNLVVYPKGKSAPPPGQPTSGLWSSGTGGLPHSYLELNNNGNTLSAWARPATVFWQCGFLGEGPSELRAGGVLRPNQSLWSPNGQVILTMQQDGNLVEYQNLTPAAPSFCQPFDYSNANVIQLFQSKTSGHIGPMRSCNRTAISWCTPKGWVLRKRASQLRHFGIQPLAVAEDTCSCRTTDPSPCGWTARAKLSGPQPDGTPSLRTSERQLWVSRIEFVEGEFIASRLVKVRVKFLLWVAGRGWMPH